MSTEEIVTEEELAAAIGRMGWLVRLPMEPAQILLEDIKRHREPVPEPGEAWEDATGEKFLRSRIGDWVECSGTRLADRDMTRPLRRLVPEADLAKPTYYEIRDAIEAGDPHDPVKGSSSEIASRVMKLLEAHSDH